MNAVDVVVPTRNTRELTLRCLESVLGDSPATCTVVDNASTDGTAEAVRARFPQVTVLGNDQNAGFATACNQGAAGGSAQFLLFLNSDVRAKRGAVARLASFMEEHPACVAAGGRLVDPGTERTQIGFTLRAFPRLAGQLALLLGVERVWRENPLSRRQLMLDFDYSRTQFVKAQPAGACLVCRRAAFEGVGGFDEGYTYWFEDADLICRLADRGTIAYVHDAVFEHVGAATFAQWDRAEVVRARFHGLFRYFRKHRPKMENAGLRATVFPLVLLRALLASPVSREVSRAYLEVAGAAFPARAAKKRCRRR